MSSPVRKKQVRRAILETLEMAKGYALEQGALEMHVNDLLRPPVEHEESGRILSISSGWGNTSGS
jgi:hypothetical protein